MKPFLSPVPVERRAWYITIFLTIVFVFVVLAVAVALHRFISASTVLAILPVAAFIFVWLTFSYVLEVLDKNK